MAAYILKSIILTSYSHGLDPASTSWLKQEPTMLVGIDVTHPGPATVKGTPSIAAVVASIDDAYGQFPCSLEIQESKKEVGLLASEGRPEQLLTYCRWSRIYRRRWSSV